MYFLNENYMHPTFQIQRTSDRICNPCDKPINVYTHGCAEILPFLSKLSTSLYIIIHIINKFKNSTDKFVISQAAFSVVPGTQINAPLPLPD